MQTQCGGDYLYIYRTILIVTALLLLVLAGKRGHYFWAQYFQAAVIFGWLKDVCTVR